MKTVGIIGINGMVGQKMLAELQKVKLPFEIKTFGRNDEIPALDIAVLCTDNPVSRELAPALKNRVKFIVDMSSEFRMSDGVPPPKKMLSTTRFASPVAKASISAISLSL